MIASNRCSLLRVDGLCSTPSSQFRGAPVCVFSGRIGSAVRWIRDKETQLYLKADDSNRAAFEGAGSLPFTPPVPAGRAQMTMPYYEAPADVLDDGEALRSWARTSIDVAHATPPKKPRARK